MRVQLGSSLSKLLIGSICIALLLLGAVACSSPQPGASDNPPPTAAAATSSGEKPTAAPVSPQPVSAQTPVAKVDPTSTPNATATAAAISRATSTAQAGATATVQAQATVQAVATSEALKSTVDALTKNKEKVGESFQGELEVKEGSVVRRGWDARLSDFVVEGTFFNPFDANDGPWDYGVMFRRTGGNEQYRLFVQSDRDWSLRLAQSQNGGSSQEIASGSYEKLDTSGDGKNVLKLVCKESTAYFYINSDHVATLDVSQKTDAGEVAVATGFISQHKLPGTMIRYEGFELWALE